MTPVFIVAQYKCGTSWLLSALSAHPDILGIREIDIIRAAYAHSSQADAVRKSEHGSEKAGNVPHPLVNRYRALLAKAKRRAPALLQPLFESADRFDADSDTAIFPMSNLMVNAVNPDRLRFFFCKSAWSSSPETPTHLDAGQHPTAFDAEVRNFAIPQSIRDLSPAQAVELYSRIRDAAHPHQALDAFIEAVSAEESGASHVVLKAADQVSVLDALQRWQPDAKKIAITRDGRDAAISALHYKKLMKERNAAWLQGSEQDYWDLLRGWAVPAQRMVDAACSGELLLIRYEDLSHDFSGTFSRVLDFLEVDSNPDIVQTINDATSFQSRTGRERGTSGKGVLRKGMVNEWKEYLSEDDRARAWRTYRSLFEALGYTESGELEPLSY